MERKVTVILAVFLIFVGSALAQVSLIDNPSFENNGGVNTSSFAGWTVVNQAGGLGSWYVQAGTSPPIGGAAVPAAHRRHIRGHDGTGRTGVPHPLPGYCHTRRRGRVEL